MREADVEIILQSAKEKFSDICPIIISDNGPQFIAKDFFEEGDRKIYEARESRKVMRQKRKNYA